MKYFGDTMDKGIWSAFVTLHGNCLDVLIHVFQPLGR